MKKYTCKQPGWSYLTTPYSKHNTAEIAEHLESIVKARQFRRQDVEIVMEKDELYIAARSSAMNTKRISQRDFVKSLKGAPKAIFTREVMV